MAEPIKFSELTNAGTLDLSAIMAIVQQQAGELVSLQCSMAQVAELVASGATYQELTTEQKTLISAINEIAAGGGGGGGAYFFAEGQATAAQIRERYNSGLMCFLIANDDTIYPLTAVDAEYIQGERVEGVFFAKAFGYGDNISVNVKYIQNDAGVEVSSVGFTGIANSRITSDMSTTNGKIPTDDAVRAYVTEYIRTRLAQKLDLDLGNISTAGEQKIRDIAGGGGSGVDPVAREEIAQVKDSLTELDFDVVDHSKGEFVLGNLDTQGEEIDANLLLRSDFYFIGKAVSLVFNANRYYDLTVVLYDAEKNYIRTIGNIMDYTNDDFYGFVRVVLRKNGITEMTEELKAEMISDFKISRNNLNNALENIVTTVISSNNVVNDVKEQAIIYELNTEEEYNLLKPDNYTLHSLALPDGRIVVNTSWEYCTSDYIEIDPTKEFICNYINILHRVYNATTQSYDTTSVSPFERGNFAFYDKDKNAIPYTGNTSATSKAIPINAKYIRVSLAKAQYIPFARLIYGNFSERPLLRIVDYKQTQKNIYYRPNSGFENLNMVMFGDSITHGDLGIDDNGVSYVDYVNDYLGSKVINVGFGGSRMSEHGASGGTAYFSFNQLADAIVEDVWTNQDSYISSNQTYAPHLTKLKAIDWSNIHAIGLLYGANDYMSNTQVGTEYNTDVSKYDGACAYGLNKLLTKYPHLQVILFTPFYRQPTAVDVLDDDTDNANNGIGLKMVDYGASLKNVQTIVHCPIVDTYREFNINRYNMKLYTWDGTHPRCDIANKRLGRLFAESIKRYIVPVN